MHEISQDMAGFLSLFLGIASCSLTLTAVVQCSIYVVGDEPARTVANTMTTSCDDFESTAIPEATVRTDVESAEAGYPPPYQPAASQATLAPTPESNSTILAPPKPTRSTAESFVIGSFLLILNLSSLIIGAFVVQANIYCNRGPYRPLTGLPAFFFWVTYSAIAFWATFGVTCWARLFRDLWGPQARKRWPIKGNIFVAAVEWPFVKFVEACQRTFCGQALEDEEELMRRETTVELEVIRLVGSVGDDVEGSSNRERREEMVSLMGSIDK
jgi:hypothetical protein